MTRSLYAGSTNYSHQSLSQMIDDLRDWINSLNETNQNIKKDVATLKEISYWEKVYPAYSNFIFHCKIFFETTTNEIEDILPEINIEIMPHHVTRLKNLGDVAEDLNSKIGSLWNNEYPAKMKDYESDEFRHVEHLYTITRDMLADLMDLQNLSERLNNFVGKRNLDLNYLQKFKNFIWHHKYIAFLVIIGIIIIYISKFTEAISNINNFINVSFINNDSTAIANKHDSTDTNNKIDTVDLSKNIRPDIEPNKIDSKKLIENRKTKTKADKQDSFEERDHEKTKSERSSIENIEQTKLRFGLTLGWQLARFEFIDESTLPEAQAVAPSIRSNIADLLSADGFPFPISKLGYRDLIQKVLTYYGTTDNEKHSVILVGISAFRTSLVGASKDKSNNQELQQLAFSALQEIDPRILPEKKIFFQQLLLRQPSNVPELLEIIDSHKSTPKITNTPPTSTIQKSFVTRLTVWAEIDANIYVDGIHKMSIDHSTGLDYSGVKVRVAPNSIITIKAVSFERSVSLWSLCDAKSEDCELRVGTQQMSDIQLTEEEKITAMGNSADIPALVSELSEGIKYPVRAWAAERLGYIGGKPAIDGLLYALHDPEPYVQAIAAEALGRIGDPSVLPKLEEAYSKYSSKSSYGYMFESAIKDLKFVKKQEEN